MTSPLVKPARGLLDLLRLRTQGDMPTKFSDTVQVGIEGAGMYGSDLQQVQTTSSAAGAISTFLQTTMLVPGRLLGFGGFTTIGAAAGTRLSQGLVYSPGGNFSGCPVGVQVWTAPHLVAAGVMYAAAQLTEPIVFPAGSVFAMQVQGDAGGADHTSTLRILFENYTPQ